MLFLVASEFNCPHFCFLWYEQNKLLFSEWSQLLNIQPLAQWGIHFPVYSESQYRNGCLTGINIGIHVSVKWLHYWLNMMQSGRMVSCIKGKGQNDVECCWNLSTSHFCWSPFIRNLISGLLCYCLFKCGGLPCCCCAGNPVLTLKGPKMAEYSQGGQLAIIWARHREWMANSVVM